MVAGNVLERWSEFDEECPVHGTHAKKEYEIGMMDARVYVYAGCKCAVCLDCERGTARYYPSYNEAAGCAYLIKAEAALPLAARIV